MLFGLEKKNEFHKSLSLNIDAYAMMNKRDKRKYDHDLTERRIRHTKRQLNESI